MLARHAAGSDEAFWAQFSTQDGAHMSYTQIRRRLQERRIADDHLLAEQARQLPDFSEHFTYRRGGRVTIMVKDADIARRWRKLYSLGDSMASGSEDEEE